MDTNSTEQNYQQKEVKKIVRKRNILLLSMLFFPLFVGGIDYLFKSDIITKTAAILYFLSLGWQLIVVNFFKCPRCHKVFWTKFWSTGIANKCVHCGLGVDKPHEFDETHMTNLEEILYEKTNEYKNKSYTELKYIVDELQCFNVMHKNKPYTFEIHALLGSNNELKLMVECSRNIFFFSFFGKHRYFAITQDGKVRDIDGDVYWE